MVLGEFRFRFAERAHFGTNIFIPSMGIDCSVAETNAVCETPNGVTRERYCSIMECRVRNVQLSAMDIAKDENFAMVAWCLFHQQRRAWQKWCASAKTPTPPGGIARADGTEIVVSLLDQIRRAGTYVAQHTAAQSALRLLSAPLLSDIAGLPNAKRQTSSCGRRRSAATCAFPCPACGSGSSQAVATELRTRCV